VEGLATAAKPGQVVVLRVTVRADDLESFIARYSRHLDGDRIFIFTKSPQPVGTRVRFTLQLANGEQLIHGKGTVTRVQQESGNPRFPSGMELVFVALDDRSQTLVDFMLASREAEAPPIVRAVQPSSRPPPPPPPTNNEIPPGQSAPPAPEPSVVVAPEAAASVAAPELPPDQPPAPALAEKWHEPLPPGPPAAGGDANVPANPFSEISDNAIEYFVEWSLEQSIGKSKERTSHFSNVPMALSEGEAEKPKAPRRLYLVGAGAFVVGAACGALVIGLVMAHRPPAKIVEAPVAAPVQPAPPPTEGALSVTSRPPGASVTIDGKPAGTTPLNLKLPVGAHEVAVAKDRYQRMVSSANVPADLDLELKRPLAELRVVSTPPGAEVLVAGTSRGKTPLAVKLPQFEKYEVVVQLEGTRPWKKSIYLRAEKNAVKASLPKLGAR
jgi:uncharacterized protein (TIGR02266 family)